jgi:hypothetical protein
MIKLMVISLSCGSLVEQGGPVVLTMMTPYKLILVDEIQDFTAIQHHLLDRMLAKGLNTAPPLRGFFHFALQNKRLRYLLFTHTFVWSLVHKTEGHHDLNSPHRSGITR